MLSNMFAYYCTHADKHLLPETVCFSNWCDYFAFDVMGDLGIGSDFGMIDKATPHIYVEFMHNAVRAVAISSHLPWIKPISEYQNPHRGLNVTC